MAADAGARDRVLAAVRAALAGPGASQAGDTPDLKARPAGEAGAPRAPDPKVRPPTDLLASFVASATAADACVTVVRSADEARCRLDEIIHDERARRLVVSPDASGPPWRCGRQFRSDDVRFVTRSASRNERAEALEADLGVTVPARALADTGTLVLFSSPGDHRLDSLLPPVHVALVDARMLVPDLATLFARLAAEQRFVRHSAVTFVRGPSRTADIELTLTIGVHGPRRLYIVVLDERVEAASTAAPA